MLKWDESMNIGIREIDDQHQVFVNLINDLYKSIDDSDAPVNLKPFLEKLHGYAHYHFGTEENYFEKFHYQDSAAHSAEHSRISKRVTDFIEEYEIRGMAIIPQLAMFLSEWLVAHTQTIDRKYVSCFKEHGL